MNQNKEKLKLSVEEGTWNRRRRPAKAKKEVRESLKRGGNKF